jgi:hypothetical protein
MNDFYLAVAVDPDPVQTGNILTSILTITNPNPNIAIVITITAKLPKGLPF